MCHSMLMAKGIYFERLVPLTTCNLLHVEYLLVSKVVPCAVMLQVLVLRPLVTMTENSYKVLGLRPVTV